MIVNQIKQWKLFKSRSYILKKKIMKFIVAILFAAIAYAAASPAEVAISFKTSEQLSFNTTIRGNLSDVFTRFVSFVGLVGKNDLEGN